jgi:hypothetical protein
VRFLASPRIARSRASLSGKSRHAGHSREKPALSLPKGGNPALSGLNWILAYSLVVTHILGWTQGAEVRNLALSLGPEHVPHLLLDTGGASATDAEMSPEGAGYPALRDQANGLGPRIHLFLGGKP